MSKKKKKESVGVISGKELLKKSYDGAMAPFRFEDYQTEKDKPRKKMKPREYNREDW